jgi:colicin import membrane protein
MPGFLQEHRGPLAGAAGLHLALLAIFAGAALRWTSSQPPVELAIEGYVVEGPVRVRPLREPAEAAPAAESLAPAPQPRVERREQQPEPDAAAVERAARLETERRAAEQAEARREAQEAEALQAMQAAEAAQRKTAAEVARKTEAEAARKAAEEETRRKAEAAEAAQRKTEAEAARRAAEEETRRKAAAAETARQKAEAEARVEREAALQRRLAAEEEALSFARSGVIDEYRSLLVQTIERNWIRPPSARAGLQCTLYVTQAPGGTVVDVRLGACNGDEPVRESIVNAVYRSSPLPAPRDPRAFERRLEIVFRPKE